MELFFTSKLFEIQLIWKIWSKKRIDPDICKTKLKYEYVYKNSLWQIAW